MKKEYQLAATLNRLCSKKGNLRGVWDSAKQKHLFMKDVSSDGIFYGHFNFYKIDDIGIVEAGEQGKKVIWTRNGEVEIYKEKLRRARLVKEVQSSINERTKQRHTYEDDNFFIRMQEDDHARLIDRLKYQAEFDYEEVQQKWLKGNQL